MVADLLAGTAADRDSTLPRFVFPRFKHAVLCVDSVDTPQARSSKGTT